VTRSTGVETLHDSSATVSGPSDTSSVFTVQQAPLAFPFTYPADTVCVRVITTDGFYSKWTRDPVFWVNPGDGVPSQDDIPIVFALHQNFPNPFNPSSTICYDLPRTTHVTLAVYDLLGREVASLVDEVQEPGYRRAEWIPMSVASGVYFCRLVAGSFAECRKMLLVR